MWWLLSCSGLILIDGKSVESTGAAEAFALTEVVPAHALASGGDVVVLRGSGLSAASSLRVGGVACLSQTLLSSAEMLCTVPPGAPGPTRIEAEQDGVVRSLEFRYDAADSGDTTPESQPDPVDDTGASALSCVLDGPLDLRVAVGTPTPPIESRVTLPGRTDGEGAGIGIAGELGYGLVDDTASYSWSPMTYLASDGAADSWAGSFVPPYEATWSFAARFRVDDGEAVLCRGTGSELGLVVAATPVPVSYCHLQHPCQAAAASGATSETIYAWIYQTGVTDTVGAGAGLHVELGIGADGTTPDDPSWAWTPMSWFSDKDGLVAGDLSNDEYAGTAVVPSAPGSYDYAARVSADAGLSWTWCDAGGSSCGGLGSDDGYASASAGQLDVHAAATSRERE